MESPVPDIMTFLFDEYKKELKETNQEDKLDYDEGLMEVPVLEFIDWAKNYLSTKNYPINVAFLAAGIGLRLVQGQVVAFVNQEAVSKLTDNSVAVFGTATQSNMVPSAPVSVFGN